MTEDPFDFSSLDPSRDDAAWERRVAETVEQAELRSALDLTALDPYPTRAQEDDVVRRILDATAEPVVVRLAPKALAVAALLAAASWLLVWVEAEPPGADPDPALAALSWAQSGEPLSLEQMGALTGSEVRDER